MTVAAHYASQNPSNDELTLWQGHQRIARIDAGTFLNLLSPPQKAAWLNGQYVFNIKPAALREGCSRQYQNF